MCVCGGGEGRGRGKGVKCVCVCVCIAETTHKHPSALPSFPLLILIPISSTPTPLTPLLSIPSLSSSISSNLSSHRVWAVLAVVLGTLYRQLLLTVSMISTSGIQMPAVVSEEREE